MGFEINTRKVKKKKKQPWKQAWVSRVLFVCLLFFLLILCHEQQMEERPSVNPCSGNWTHRWHSKQGILSRRQAPGSCWHSGRTETGHPERKEGQNFCSRTLRPTNLLPLVPCISEEIRKQKLRKEMDSHDTLTKFLSSFTASVLNTFLF